MIGKYTGTMLLLLALFGCAGTAATDVVLDSSPTDSPSDSPLDSRDSPHSEDTAPAGPPQVVLFIGDGMGLEQVGGGGLYKNGEASTLGLDAMPIQGRIRTASFTGVTDSAASGTVMSTGTKTYNEYLGLDIDGNTLENVVEVARARGMATGVVTTDRISGATPASFLVHIEDRGDYADICAAIALSLPDVLLGGGTGDCDEVVFDTTTIDYLTTADELTAWIPAGRPLLGMFDDGTFPYVFDGYDTQPSLSHMTTTAITTLLADPDGFFLMVEGARIDHASHSNDSSRVFPEMVAFDDAITAGMALLGPDATVLVTADHECGGLHVISGNGVGEAPDAEWRDNWHTNADVGVWGSGTLPELFAGGRFDNAWIHAALLAAITQSGVIAPNEPALVDGWLGDLSDAIVSQPWESSFDPAFNRIDALRIGSDATGLRIGVDGVFEDDANALVLFLDTDYSDSTGFPHTGDLTDIDGDGDTVISSLNVAFADETFGAERVIISVHGQYAFRGSSGGDNAGVRDITSVDDFGWLESAINFDSDNMSLFNAEAPDAGVAEEGFEIQMPWDSIYGASSPEVERKMAVVAVLVNDTGTYVSNQALPPFSDETEPGSALATLPGEVHFVVDGLGDLVGTPVVVP